MLYRYRQFYSLHKNVVYIKMIFIKTFAKYVETRFDTSTYELDHHLKEKRKKLLVQ